MSNLVRIHCYFFHSSSSRLLVRPRWQFDGAVWTLTASETVPTLSEQGTVRILGERFVDEHGRMRAGWWRVGSVGVRSSKDRRSGPTRLPSASRITVAPGHCVRSQQSGQQSALRSSEFGFLPVSVDRLYSRLPSASGCVHRKKRRFACIFLSGSRLVSVNHPTLPLVAACSCTCVLRAFPAGTARQCDLMRRLRATCIAKRTVRYNPVIIRPSGLWASAASIIRAAHSYAQAHACTPAPA